MVLYFIIPSALVGALSRLFIGRKKSGIVASYVFAGALPWLGLMAVLM